MLWFNQGGCVIFASDLDNTLIYSNRKYGNDVSEIMVADRIDGEIRSFMPLEAYQELRLVRSMFTFIPVTTRNIEQYNRIGFKCNHAIVNNGATVLLDGKVDLEWDGRIKEQMNKLPKSLEEVSKELDEWFSYLFEDKVTHANGFFEYRLFKAPPTIVATQRLFEYEGDGWTISIQGRKLYCIPTFMTKKAALLYVADMVEEPIVACAGDAELDYGMLECAEHPIMPKHGDIGGACKGTYITKSEGFDASTEILKYVYNLIV